MPRPQPMTAPSGLISPVARLAGQGAIHRVKCRALRAGRRSSLFDLLTPVEFTLWPFVVRVTQLPIFAPEADYLIFRLQLSVRRWLVASRPRSRAAGSCWWQTDGYKVGSSALRPQLSSSGEDCAPDHGIGGSSMQRGLRVSRRWGNIHRAVGVGITDGQVLRRGCQAHLDVSAWRRNL